MDEFTILYQEQILEEKEKDKELQGKKEINKNWILIDIEKYRIVIEVVSILIAFFLIVFNILIVTKFKYYFDSLLLGVISNFSVGVCIALLTSSLSSVIFKIYFEKKKELERKKNLMTQVSAFWHTLKLQKVADSGIVGTFENIRLNLEKIHSKAKKSEEIRIFSTYLEEPLFELYDFHNFVEEGRCKSVKILLLAPDSEIVNAREKSLGLNISSKISHMLNRFKGFEKTILKDSNNKKFKIETRTYDFYPPLYYVMCDSYAVVGFYWHDERATARTMIEVEGKNSPFIKNLKAEFDSIFNDNLKSKKYTD